jgi:hypothetical protein
MPWSRRNGSTVSTYTFTVPKLHLDAGVRLDEVFEVRA